MLNFTIVLLISVLCSFFINYTVLKFSRSINPDKAKGRLILTIICTSIIFITTYLAIGFNVVLVKYLLLDCILVIVIFIDSIHNIIPNKIIVTLICFGIVSLIFRDINIINAVCGMVIGGAILFLLALIPGAIGGGDVKLIFSLGLFLGVKGILLVIIYTFILSSVVSVVLLLFKIKKAKDYIPLGPFIAISIVISYFL